MYLYGQLIFVKDDKSIHGENAVPSVNGIKTSGFNKQVNGINLGLHFATIYEIIQNKSTTSI